MTAYDNIDAALDRLTAVDAEAVLAEDIAFWDRLMSDVRAYDEPTLVQLMRDGLGYEDALAQMRKIGRQKECPAGCG